MDKISEKQVKEYYDKCAEEWDIEGCNLDRIKLNESFIGDAFNDISNILDIGCSGGGLTRYYSSLGYKITGVDFSPKMIKYANDRKDENMEFICGDGLNLNYNKSFDLVIACGTIEHFNTNNDKGIMKKLCSYSKKYIFLDFPTIAYRETHKELSQIIDRKVNIKKIKAGIEDSGFEIIKSHFYDLTPEGLYVMYGIFAERKNNG